MAGEFSSRQAACDARRDYMERQGHLQKRIVNGVPWWNLSAGVWLDQSCLVYDAPNGNRRPNKTFGLVCVTEDSCPDPTPTPPPNETPTPPPTECVEGPNGITIDFFWAGQTSKNPVLYLRDAPQNGFWSASFFCDVPWKKIHDTDPRYPGGIPTFKDGHVEGHDGTGWFVQDPSGNVIVSGKDHRGAALAEAVIRYGAVTSWQQQVIHGDNLDCTWSSANGHNIGCHDHDFLTKLRIWVEVLVNRRWLTGEGTVTVQ